MKLRKRIILQLKAAILAAYRLIEDSYREKFRISGKTSTETFRQFGSRLNLYIRRWFNASDSLLSDCEFSQIMDKLVINELKHSLRDQSLRMKLLEQKWSSLKALTEMADDLFIARATSRNRQQVEPETAASIPPRRPSPMYSQQQGTLNYPPRQSDTPRFNRPTQDNSNI